MARLVTVDLLKEDLTTFKARGDEHWATKAEIPTQESIGEMVDEALHENLGSLTEIEVQEICNEL